MSNLLGLVENSIGGFKKDNDYFKLNISEQPQLYEKVSNSEVLNALDKIYNGY